MGSDRPSLRVGIAIRAAIALLAVSASNSALCGEPVFSTKWAMDNDDYARLYSEPYSDDPLIRRSQRRREMSDARFQEDTYGVYVGGGGALNNWSVGEADVGIFKMPNACTTVRLGAIGMVAGGQPMAGGELGVRLHTPTRLAPYVGLAGVLELSGFERHATGRSRRSYYDNSGHQVRPPWGYFPTGMAAIVPEAGVSYWLSSSTRLNLGASYFVTGGRQPDFLQASLSMDFALQAPPEERVPAQFLERDYESGSQPIPGDPYFKPGAPVWRDVGEPTPDPTPDPIPDPPLGSLGPPPAQLDSRANSFPVMLSNPKVVFPSPAEALPPTLSPLADSNPRSDPQGFVSNAVSDNRISRIAGDGDGDAIFDCPRSWRAWLQPDNQAVTRP